MDNNLNQNNQIENNGVAYNSTLSNQSVQINQSNLDGGTNTSKKNSSLIVFGIVLIIAIVLVITLFIENKNNNSITSSLINENTKTLIVYFSKDGENYGKNLNIENKRILTEGNTKVMARKISTFIKADLYEIKPLIAYPEDLNELYARTKIEYNQNIYPEIENKITNLDSYDVIFIGYPIWHASFPQIIKTFVRDNKEILKNKIIVPFNTHAGSGSAGTYKKLFNLIGIPDNRGLNGLSINGTEVENSEENIVNWLKGIGYNVK